MDQVKIYIEFNGTRCNNWPRVKVIGNNYTYFDAEVVKNKIIEFTMPLQDRNCLILEHYGKKFGENGIWDTRSNGDQITEDRAVKLIKLELNEVDISPYLVRQWPFITDSGQSIPTDYFGFNGACHINFDSPVYDWIIKTLVHDPSNVKVKAQDLIIETSHNDLFNYNQDIETLKEIEQLLKENAYLFNKSP